MLNIFLFQTYRVFNLVRGYQVNLTYCQVLLPLKCKKKCFNINFEVGLLTLLANYQLCPVQFMKSDNLIRL